MDYKEKKDKKLDSRKSSTDITPLLDSKYQNQRHNYYRFNSFPVSNSSAVEMTSNTLPRQLRSVFLGVDVGTGSARAGGVFLF